MPDLIRHPPSLNRNRMLLFAALAFAQPTPPGGERADPAAQILPSFEPTRLEISSGRLGGSTNTIEFTYAPARGATNAPIIRFSRTFFDPRSNTTSRQATDSIACPDAASILRAVPLSASATTASADAPLVILLHGSTYSLSGRLRYPERSPTDFTMTGNSLTPFGWWTQELFAALASCWLDKLAPNPPAPPPAAH